jgi:superfamily II RNA helicase
MSTNPAPLAALLPKRGETLDADEILNRFVGFVSSTGLSLYSAQEEAILELLGGKHLILNTPTGSGKSLVATALHYKAMAEGKRSFYTCPIKALVNEKFFALCNVFGPENVGMMTGDASINRDALIICCTAEILSNLALRDKEARVDYVIMDEFHYYADKERGVAWQIPLLALTDTTFLMMSATLGDMTTIVEGIQRLTQREVAQVRSSQRPVPLDFEYKETPLHETIEKLIEAGKYPVYLVNFTQRAAAEQAQNLMSVNFCTKEEKEQIRQALMDVKFDTAYGKDFQKFLRHGVGMHHAGLLPKYRLLVEKLAQQGLLKVISGTDTLGVGVNIPIRTVLFTQLCKFDGEKVGILSVRDFHQIAGRAGRKGFDDQGTVVVQAPEHVIENIKLGEKEQKTGKKQVKRQPPQKGYVHWDKNTFERLLSRLPEPLESRFTVTHGILLNLIQSSQAQGKEGGYGRLVELIRRSHGSDYVKRQLLRTAATYFRTLRQAGIVEVIRGEGGWGGTVRVSPNLQRDFSLNYTLSLYLLSTLERLDRSLETYALDVLSLVESILENPDVVLYAQLNKLKGDKVNELKAQGMEYDDRMEELEKLEWPKPNRDFIYATFNEFSAKHPWVGQENIRPKSIAREMVETYCTFNDYVREYGLQRSEGVLLRYLSQVYKALEQTVPESFKTEEIHDIAAHLRLMLRQTDSSLIDEWETMKDPLARLQPGGAAAVEERPKLLGDDPRELASRIRSELHGLLRALADKRYEDALGLLRPGEMAWTPELLQSEMERYFAQFPSVDMTPRARRPDKTQIKQVGPKQWEARQKILDPEGNEDWALECFVDLREPRPEEQPIIELRRIGI